LHPILGNLRRLTLYLVAWIPLAGLVAYLFVSSAGFRWAEAAALIVPLCLIYAFVCLSAWYTCRGNPLERSSITSLIGAHGIAAVIAGGFWVLSARVLGAGLARFGSLAGLEAKVARISALVFALGVLFYLLAVGLFYVLIAIEASQQAEHRALEAQVFARDAELRALKAQVNPHFIFNSLHSISALTGSDPAKAREMCILLGDFLRRTLGLGEKSLISLEEELALVRSFLSVEKVRFGARLEMREEIDDKTLDCQVPPLLLQPLVENAVVHGISNLVDGGWVRVTIQPEGENLEIAVENQWDSEAPKKRRNGLGLENVRRRLATTFGNRARMDTTSNGDAFRVSMTLPADRKGGAL
jgi:two-component system, LytTR family, sensor histidine kinase AlgZ